MTDEELAKIEVENQRRFEADLTCCGSYNDTAKLIAEVRRLKGELDKANLAIEMLGGHPLT